MVAFEEKLEKINFSTKFHDPFFARLHKSFKLSIALMSLQFTLPDEFIEEHIDVSRALSLEKLKPIKLDTAILSDFLSVIHILGSYTSGVCKTTSSYCFIIPVQGMFRLNGYTIESAESLQIGLMSPEHLTNYSVLEPCNVYMIIADKTVFDHRCEILLRKKMMDVEHKGFVYFKDNEVKIGLFDQLKSLITPPKLAHIAEAQLADELLNSFILSLNLHAKNIETLNYCNNIAVQVHSYLLQHVHEPLSLEQISSANGANGRSIQKGFKELYGMGPVRYHKLLRLFKVRRYLQHNGLVNTRLVDLIGMYGFYHSGRFSEYYKKTFAILPSEESRV